MAHTPEIIPVGNNQVFDNDEEFSSGFLNGHLHYYDTNMQLPRPLTCQAIYAFMQENLTNPRESERWNAGFVFGWISALNENDPASFYTSIMLPETEAVQYVML